MTKLYAKKSQFFSPFFFLSFFREEGKKNGEIVLKKRLCERGVTYVYILHTKMEKEAPKTGTTIVACEYADGVVVGADTRVSTGTFRCRCCCVSRDFCRRSAPFYFTFFVRSSSFVVLSRSHHHHHRSLHSLP